MGTPIKWKTEDSVLLMPGTGNSDTDLKDIQANNAVLSAAIDNRNGHQYIDFELTAELGAATAGYVNIWLIKSLDGGTKYERGSVASRVITAPARTVDHMFPLAAVTTSQPVSSPKMLAPSCHFKVLVEWKGVTAATGDSKNMLRYQFSNDEAQTA